MAFGDNTSVPEVGTEVMASVERQGSSWYELERSRMVVTEGDSLALVLSAGVVGAPHADVQLEEGELLCEEEFSCLSQEYSLIVGVNGVEQELEPSTSTMVDDLFVHHATTYTNVDTGFCDAQGTKWIYALSRWQ